MGDSRLEESRGKRRRRKFQVFSFQLAEKRKKKRLLLPPITNLK
jgi:hypothetical protein